MLAKNFFWPAPDTPPQSFFNYCNNWVTGIKKEWSVHWCADIAHFVGGNLDKNSKLASKSVNTLWIVSFLAYHSVTRSQDEERQKLSL